LEYRLMSTCSHALYLALTQDLSPYLPASSLLNPKLGPADLPPEHSVKTFSALSLYRSFFKKFEDDPSKDSDEKSLLLFISMNDRCRDYVFPDIWSLPEEQVHVFSKVRALLDKWTCSGNGLRYSDFDILSHCDFGPGSAVGSSGTSFYHKAGSGKLTCTDPSLYSFYIESIRTSATWIKAEKLRRDLYGAPNVVSGSKLCFVPKSTEISRVICVEPSLNMFIQKGLASCLEATLSKSIGFDLESQQFRNRRLARYGSKTGKISTIDLSSASDTIALSFCEKFLPPILLEWLKLCRSPKVLLPDGSEVVQHMISSMGNATTFPLQTMIFSAIAMACHSVCGVEFIRPSNSCDGNLGVFGDDIVVDTRVYPLLVRCLETAGFIPNHSKSFNTGRFRESCGGDFFDGHFVRGVYCRTLKGQHAKFSLINRLHVWIANNGIPLDATISYLLSKVRFLPVPLYESDIAGIKVPRNYANVKADKNGSLIYRRLVARTIGFDVSDEKQFQKGNRFKVIYNPDAILLAATKGSLRNGSLNVRLDVVRPHYRFGISPCWDYIDLDHTLLECGNQNAWKQAISRSLVVASFLVS
jgi:hypothetical protein